MYIVSSYLQSDPVTIKVNKLTSIKTQLPYEYYSLDYCKPQKIENVAENLGEVLRGDRIENSPYEVSILDHLMLFRIFVLHDILPFMTAALTFELFLKVTTA